MWIFVIIIGLPLILILLIPWCSLVVFLTWKSFDAFDRDSALTWQNSHQSEQGRNLPHYLRNPWISKKKITWLRNELSWYLHYIISKHFLTCNDDYLRSCWWFAIYLKGDKIFGNLWRSPLIDIYSRYDVEIIAVTA